ncbi:MAG: TonB-dependent receptor [Candidatus Latescibacteria bacterium]|nr:TonB-dependent receptor [Candidatus Latescibacterota bacterium]NIM64430.1 TonB-dependent receptor [Candidatus Latescibacterota bacterium]NIO00584.1 TonB-dependent receptor [Candidatus Latescibacterota bacterium]NIO26984.1 TonB-dependent receptor [Candidatus Latescibacterota bacterium]NIO56061.1 TonB-dependent receptor [Candidatus Latescibacterota bacterium]
MKLVVVSIIAFIVVLHTIPLLAQEITGNIEGRIVDQAGEPVAFANVNVSSPSLQGMRGMMSTADGHFGIFKLPVGVYTVRISHVSYHEATYEDVAVRLGRTTTLGEIRLTLKVHEVPAVVVTEERKLIDPTSTAIGVNLSAEQFKELPLDRNYQNITTLLPHANESFFGDGVNFAGSTGQENKYFIDGVETTDPHMGITGTTLPYNFLQELEVKTGGYEAEYRSSLGGIVNVISRSGGNEFHGQAFGFFVNNELTGTTRHSFMDPPTGDFANYDVGLSLGGPIKRDKLWFFAAYNPSFVIENVNIPGIGFHEDKSITHIFAGKLTWRATNKTNLDFTITGDPRKREAVEDIAAYGVVSLENPDPSLGEHTTGGINLLVNGRHLFSDKFFLEAAVSRVTRRQKIEASTERGRNEVVFVDRETGIASGGYSGFGPSDAYSAQMTANAKATLILGKHMLKTGLEYRDSRLDFANDLIIIERYDDSTYTETIILSRPGTVHNRIPSAFIQESWRITDRIRINAGFRWDGQYLIDTNGDVAQKITDQYQPRIGFVYQPGELGSQKIFGSFGRFYQELHLELSNRAHTDRSVFSVTEFDHDPRVDPTGGTVSLAFSGEIHPEVEGLDGQHYDEFTLGYERQVGNRFTLGARGIYRTLREGIEDGFVEDIGDFRYGNPGKGYLSDFPEMKREYTALELTAQMFGGARYNARASYVLSRNYGNYPGLIGLPNLEQFELVESMKNAEGLLDNDRTHVFKLSGSYRPGFGFAAGASFTWQRRPDAVHMGSELPVCVRSSPCS